jgi:hypothetical protein
MVTRQLVWIVQHPLWTHYKENAFLKSGTKLKLKLRECKTHVTPDYTRRQPKKTKSVKFNHSSATRFLGFQPGKKLTGALRTRQILQNCLHACRASGGGEGGCSRYSPISCLVIPFTLTFQKFPPPPENKEVSRMLYPDMFSFIFQTECIMKCAGVNQPPQDVPEFASRFSRSLL